MKHEIVICGVGGQGILTIARVLSNVAASKGLSVKQAEVHGMSQRGGAVHAHLRISDGTLHSDLIAKGRADMVLAVEPLEALRYIDYLSHDGAIVSGTNVVANIANYPPVEGLLDRIAESSNHVLLDFDRLGRAAGSPRAANMAALGAASSLLVFDPNDLTDAIRDLSSAKGQRVVEDNLRAFRFGRNAAFAYREAIRGGGSHRAIRQWIDTLDPVHLAEDEPPVIAPETLEIDSGRLSGAEAHAFEQSLVAAHHQGRRQLFEHEVYALVELVGAISPPIYRFVPRGDMLTPDELARFPGDRVVVKVVSQNIVHKTEAGAVTFVPKNLDLVRREVDRLNALHPDHGNVEGVLIVEFVEPEFRGFGSELFVGIRATREFGPVIAAGLGGVQTEYLASRMKPGSAVAMAVALETDADEFLGLFQRTAAYDVLAGRVRGHKRIVSDGELLRCFRSFLSIARHFCVDRGEAAPDIGELEVNPFAFRNNRLVPLDGRGVMRTAAQPAPLRPCGKVSALLEPRSIGVIGVSSKTVNYGRIILQNIVKRGFPMDHLVVVKPDEVEIDGVRCVPSVSALPDPTDLIVVAAPAPTLPSIIRETTEVGHVSAAILIPGGVGETQGSDELSREVSEALAEARLKDGPVFVGPNSMGIQSRPGRYDTFFIPENKLASDWSLPARPLALVSQSGAFVASRMSKLGHLRPLMTLTIGNQMDVTVSDAFAAVCNRSDVSTIGVYVEGFGSYDGLEFVRAAKRATALGKTVVFYKAGRTEEGRSAAAGHTASIAGDYDVCVAAARRAGVLVTESFREFEQMVEVGTLLHDREFQGPSVFAVTNAGMEAVSMADRSSSKAALLRLSDPAQTELGAILSENRLGGLANPRNPLDLTPMASEEVYDAVARWALGRPDIHALIVGVVPFTPRMQTLQSELVGDGTFPVLVRSWLALSTKPIVFVIDAGTLYDDLADQIRQEGIPVFRSADEAIDVLGRYMERKSNPPDLNTK